MPKIITVDNEGIKIEAEVTNFAELNEAISNTTNLLYLITDYNFVEEEENFRTCLLNIGQKHQSLEILTFTGTLTDNSKTLLINYIQNHRQIISNVIPHKDGFPYNFLFSDNELTMQLEEAYLTNRDNSVIFSEPGI